MGAKAKMVILDFFLEPFSHEFMQIALGTAVTLAVLCASLGVLLVPRGLSMLGDGLSHATFGGVGIGLLSGLAVDEATWVAMPFAALVAVAIVALGRHTKIAGDAALGVFFAVSLALGIACLHLAARRGAGVDIEAVLFGNILGVQPSELAWMFGIGLLVLLVLWFQGPKIAYAGFYGELAAMSGVRVTVQEYILMVLTAVVTVLAVKAVGVMLVSAWLIIPAIVGRHLAKRLGLMLSLAVGASVLGSVMGLMASYYHDIPGGAAMTLSLGLLFAISLVVRGLQVRHHEV